MVDGLLACNKSISEVSIIEPNTLASNPIFKPFKPFARFVFFRVFRVFRGYYLAVGNASILSSEQRSSFAA